MRVLAIIANLVLLGIVAFLLSEKGLPRGEEWWLFLGLVVAPVLSILALFTEGRLKPPELLSLSIEAKKARLRKEIADASEGTRQH